MLGNQRPETVLEHRSGPDHNEHGAFDMADPEIIPIPSRVKDHTGTRFGRLTVLGYVGSDRSCGRNRPRFLCICDCGETHTAQGVSLVSGMVQSCGCLQKEAARRNVVLASAACDALGRERFARHGMSRQPEHNAWIGLKQRCYNPKNNRYASYGGRGITVCDRWCDSFEAFYEDMGPRPSDAHSIDRINPDGPYSPDNCRWATDEEQANNRTDNHYVEVEGRRVSLSDAETLTGISQKVILYRIRAGWPAAKWFTPVRKQATSA